jgi:RNA polymerase sigma factor (sigma-70 family)
MRTVIMARAALGSLLRHLRRLHDGSTDETDGELLRRYVGGDETAFAALVHRHAAMVWGVCRRLLANEQDAEDAFQAVFLVLLRKAPSLRSPQSLAAFLHGVAARIARKARVTAQRRRCHEMRAETPAPSDPFAAIEQRELRALLDEELARLPDKYRTPLVLCYLEGMSYRDAARQLGWRDGTICGRLARARELLRQGLLRRGLTLSGTALTAALTESASVPAATITAAARMAKLFVLGQSAGGGAVSATVATLAQSALHAMTLAKVKTVLAMIAAFCVLAGGGLAAHRLWNANGSPPQRTETPTSIKSAEQPRKESLARTDRYGDALPPGAVARFGTVRWRHAGWVTGVAFAPDGKAMASAVDEGSEVDGTVRLWDAASGVETACLRGHKSIVFGLTWSADGKTLVSVGNDGMIFVWDVAARRRRISWEGHPGSMAVAAAISPDGKLLASGGGDRTLMLWDLATGKEVRRLGGDERLVQSVAFSPDGKSLAAASDVPFFNGAVRQDPGVVRLWDVVSGKLRWEKEEETGGATSVAFAPDDKTVASAGNDSAIHIRNVTTGDQVRKIQVPEGRISVECLMSRNGRVPQKGYSCGGVLGLAYSPDGKWLASASYDGTVRIWEPRTGRQVHILRGHSREATGVSFSPDSKTLASCGRDHTIRLWDIASGKERQTRQGHTGAVIALAVSRDGRRLVSAGFDRAVRLWDSKSGAEQCAVRGPGHEANFVALSPNGQIVAAAGDDVIQLWDTATARPLRRLTRQQGKVMSVAFSPDGKMFACGSAAHKEKEGSLFVYDTVSGRELRRIVAAKYDSYQLVAFSADGKMVGSFWGSGARVSDSGVRVWDTATGRQLYHGKGEECFAFAPDGTTLVVRNKDKTIRLYDIPSGRELQRFADPKEWDYWPFALSPDGRTLARATKDHAIECWELASWKRRQRFTGHQGEIMYLLFSTDGRTLFSASRDTTVLMWDRTRSDAARKIRLTANDLPVLWRDLLGEDGERADRAIWLLAAAPELAVPFLEKHVRAVAAVAPECLARLIADLDSDRFAQREKATRELQELGELAEAALRKLRDGKPSLEVGRRAEDLLAKLRGPLPPGERLRHLRAVEVLEHIGTQPAQEVLQALARGAAGARLTREAKGALERLTNPSAPIGKN